MRRAVTELGVWVRNRLPAPESRRDIAPALRSLDAELREEWTTDRIAAIADASAVRVDRGHARAFFADLRRQTGLPFKPATELRAGRSDDDGLLSSLGLEIPRLLESPQLDLFLKEPFRERTLPTWVSETTRRIRSVRDEVVPGVREAVERGFARGASGEELRDELEAEFRKHGAPLKFGTIEGRASVIARDQVGTLNSRLTRARHELVGVRRYTWVSVGDANVRPAHEARDGEQFLWTHSHSDGHPGEPFNCRCHAAAAIRAEDLRISPRLVLAA